MADAIRSLLITLGLDSKQAEQGIDSFKDSFTELNSVLELGKKGFEAFRVVAEKTIAQIERGQAFNELSTAFRNLYGQSLALSRDGLGTLRQALDGTVDDLGILTAANRAAQAGLSPEAFLKVAEAAEKLGDVAGKSAPEALEELAQGLALGRERGLAMYVGTIDNVKAQQDFAKSIGTTADKLNEAGKLAAFQAEALRKIEQGAKAAGTGATTAGDAFERLGVRLSNYQTAVADAINENKTLITILESLGTTADNLFNKFADSQSTDFLVRRLQTLQKAYDEANLAASGGPGGNTLFDTLNPFSDTFGKDAHAQANLYYQEMVRIRSQLKLIGDEKRAAAEAQAAVHGIGPIKDAIAYGNAIGDLKNKYIDTGKGAKEAAEEAAKLNVEIAKAAAQADAASLSLGLERALEKLNLSDFRALSDQLTEATVAGLNAGITDPRLRAENERQAKTAALERAKAFSDAQRETLIDMEREIKERFQRSADFFSQVLGDVIFDRGRDMGEYFEDILKEVALSFGGQLLASLTGGFAASPEGIGAALAQQFMSALGLGRGGNFSFGSLLTSVDSGYGYTDATTGLATSLGGNTGTIAGSASLAQFAGIAAGAAVAYLQYDTANQIFGGGFTSVDDLSTTNRATLAYSTYGFSELFRLVGLDDDLVSWLDGANGDRIRRQNFRTGLQEEGNFGEDLTFRGATGPISLLDSDYALGNRTQFTDQAIGLVNPFATALSGGDKDFAGQIAGIFADAIDDGKTFTDLLISASGLIDGLGYSAAQARTDLLDMILDSKDGLEEFNAAFDALELIESGDIPGVGNVIDALRTAGDEANTFRTRIEGLEIAFHEMEEIGVDSAAEIRDYIATSFPDLIPVFEQLAAAGIDSFEEFANRTDEQIQFILNLINQFGDLFPKVMTNAAHSAADGFSDGTDRMIRKIRNLQAEIQIALDLQHELGGGNSGGGGGAGDLPPTSNDPLPPGFTDIRLNSRRISSRGHNASGIDENPRLTSRS